MTARNSPNSKVRSRADWEKIRRHAVKRVGLGETVGDVGLALGIDRKRIYSWLTRYKAEGIKGLETGKLTGRKSSLSERQLKKLFKLFEKNNDWSGSDLVRVVKKEFGLVISAATAKRYRRKAEEVMVKNMVQSWKRK